MPAVAAPPPSPAQIAAALEKRVIGQPEAVREISVALSKKLAGLSAGNILLIGSSGSGKTTLMKAVEELLRANPSLSLRSTVVRIHANVLGEEAEQGRPGERLLLRLARSRAGAAGDRDAGREAASSRRPTASSSWTRWTRSAARWAASRTSPGIRAQEALLTLVENESVPLTLPDWAGGATIEVDTSGLLFVCAGAFEGLYDAVYDRVTVGKDQGALKPVTVVDESGRAAGGAPVLAAGLAEDRGPVRVRREPAVPVALRRDGAARGARRGGAAPHPGRAAATRASGSRRRTSRPSACVSS